jgi:hypothetical protein
MKKSLVFVVAANIAAVMVGVAAAATLNWRVPAASASNTCTHYTYQYFTGNPATQPQYCYAYQNTVFGFQEHTNGIAIRDSNIFSSQTYAHPWLLWYTNDDGSGVCCSKNMTSAYGSIGSSLGQSKKAWCYAEWDNHNDYFYCTTLYTT